MKKRVVGLTILELLLVLIIAATIITVSLRRYWMIQWPEQVAGVQSDVATIMMALNQYFQNTGCRMDGTFNSNNLSPTLTDLGLKKMKRPPLVQSYETKIVDSGQRIDKTKPLYLLEVIANLSSGLNEAKIDGLKNRLNAKRKADQLIWSNLPAQALADTGNPIWILQTSSRKFKREQVQAGMVQKIVTAANCVE